MKKLTIIVALLVSILGTMIPVRGALADSQGISGKVLDENGSGIAGVRVNALYAANNAYAGGVNTLADGSYTLNLSPDSYFVQARPTDSAKPYANEYYDGVYSSNLATPVTVTTGVITGPINLSLNPAGYISGVVTASGTGVNNVPVNALDSTTFITVGNARTKSDGSGSYTINVPAGSYLVQVRPSDNATLSYMDEWNGGVYMRELAVPVPVTTGATANVNFTVEAGGVITGKVTGPSGVPLSNVSVNINDAVINSGVANVRTKSDGTYSANVPPGTYVVRTRLAQSGLPYFDKYHGDAIASQLATPVTVSLGGTTANIDISVESAGFISGQVIANGTPLANVSVNAADPLTGVGIANASTRWDGTYTINVPAGSWVLQARPSGMGLPYVDAWYGGVYSSQLSQPVTAAVGVTTPNINFTVNPAGFVTGRVTAGGTGLPNIGVNANDPATGAGIASANTRWDGSYTINVPPNVGVVLQARPSAKGLPYADVWHGGVNASQLSQPVSASVDVTIPNIDFAVIPAGFITGRVTAEGAGLPNVSVNANDPAIGYSIANTRTRLDGTYTINVPAGSWALQTRPSSNGPSYADSWYGGVYARELSQPVSAVVGATTPDINFAVNPAGFITGQVTVGSYNPANINLNAQDANSYQGVASARTRWDGTYTINVPPGSYVLKVRPDQSGLPYAAEYNGGVYAIQFASPISVAAGATVAGIDFTPSAAGFITGQVTAPGGVPLPHVNIIAAEPAYLWQMSDTRTRWDGTYTMNLPPGNFNLQVRPDTNYLPYAPKWFDNAYRKDEATPLSVTAGSNQNGVNFTLEPGGSISGRVVATSTGLPIAGVSVNAYLYSSLSIPGGQTEVGSSASVRTDFNGNYRFTVPAGLYGIRANSSGYATEWYSDTYIANQSQPVTVSTGEVSGINLSLEPGYSISGHVYSTDGAPIYGASIATNFYEQSPAGPGGLLGAISSPDGSYRVDGLPSGSIMIRAWKTDYTLQFYNGKDFSAQADRVTVGPTSQTGIDFHLTAGAGSISGFVYEADGTTPIFVYEADGITPISQRGIQVYVNDGSAWILAYRAKTLPDGSHLIPSVKPGNYRVLTAPSGYVPQWYQQKLTDTDANLVPVLPSGSTNGINFVMSRQDETAVPYQTPVGENATVSDQYLGITMNFETVTVGGTTGFLASEQSPDLADGFSLENGYYDIVTQAAYSGDITLTINYLDEDIPAGQSESDLKLWHWTGSTWEDVTVSVDTVNNIITGSVTSLSWLSLGIPCNVVWQPPVSTRDVYVAQQGSTIPIKFQLTDTAGKNVDVSVIVSVTRDSDDTIVFSGSAKLNGNHYQVNAKTKDWAPGTYTIRLSVNKYILSVDKNAIRGLSLVQGGQAKGKDK